MGPGVIWAAREGCREEGTGRRKPWIEGGKEGRGNRGREGEKKRERESNMFGCTPSVNLQRGKLSFV